jgi:hypothetical protein
MMDEKWMLIYIRWVDCYDNTGQWKTLSELGEWYEEDWDVDQVGWIYEETDDYIVLINMVCEGHDSVSHVTKIPKPWIKHREEIKLKRNAAIHKKISKPL